MLISADGADEVKNYLIALARGGDNWAAFDVKEPNTKKSIACFGNYNDAVNYCIDHPNNGIKPIENVLRYFNAFPYNWNRNIDKAAFDQQFRKFNLQPLGTYENFKASLVSGDLCAALLVRPVNMAEIRNFSLYKHFPTRYGAESGDFGLNHFLSTTSFKEAIAAFDSELLACSCLSYRDMPGLRLIAELNAEKLELAFDGCPMKNTGVLIKSGHRAMDDYRINPYYKVEDFRDFFIQIKQPVLTRFHHGKLELEFFNQKNDRLNPNEKIPYMPLTFFAGDRVRVNSAVNLDNNLKQKDKGDGFSFKIR